MTETDHLAFAQELVRASSVGSLATLDPDQGPPHASLVTVSVNQHLTPILLLSDLARHHKNIAADPAVALLVTGEGRKTQAHDDPLAGDRVTVRGMAEKTDDPADRERFLARHPSAAEYADFGDFNFFRLNVASTHLVGGFGRIHTFNAQAWPPEVVNAEALVAAEQDIVEHMNEDHADAVEAYAVDLPGKTPGGWRMTGIDPWGADLRHDAQIARLSFEERVTTPDEARKVLVSLVCEAREAARPD